jgi:hypothetical protein
MTLNPALVHHYRHYRRHGYTAEAAYWAARRFLHFRKQYTGR